MFLSLIMALLVSYVNFFSLWGHVTTCNITVQYITMEYLKKLGHKIKKVRKTKELTQEELAERSNLTLSYVSKIETGRRNPTILTLIKISEGLGIEIDDFFGGIKKKDVDVIKELRLFLDILEKKN